MEEPLFQLFENAPVISSSSATGIDVLIHVIDDSPSYGVRIGEVGIGPKPSGAIEIADPGQERRTEVVGFFER